MNYYSGQQYNIQARLSKEKRNSELVCIQFNTNNSMNGNPGWVPLPNEEFWPICPNVGDTFVMKSYWDEENSEEKTKHINWKVTKRSIMPSGPSAIEMNGIVILEVADIGE